MSLNYKHIGINIKNAIIIPSFELFKKYISNGEQPYQIIGNDILFYFYKNKEIQLGFYNIKKGINIVKIEENILKEKFNSSNDIVYIQLKKKFYFTNKGLKLKEKSKVVYYISPHAIEKFKERIQSNLSIREIADIIQNELSFYQIYTYVKDKNGKEARMNKIIYEGKSIYLPMVTDSLKGDEGWIVIKTILTEDMIKEKFRL